MPMESKKLTIQDIADHANVSKSTVSRVLNNTTPVNEEKRKAVLDAISELNFEPNSLASGLASGASMTIGLQTQQIGSPFYDLIAQGILEALAESKYSPILVDGRWDKKFELDGIQTLLRRQVDGLIVTGGNLEVEHLLEFNKRKPMLFAGRDIPSLSSQCTFIDNFAAGFKATNFLLDLGHTRLAHIAGLDQHQDAIRRIDGYKSALEEKGIQFDPSLVYPGNFDAPSGLAAVEHWLETGKEFTAIFASNDMSAFGARLALYRRGIEVPKDVSIIGLDDQPESAFMTPPLTSVRQPAFEMGVMVGKAMLNMLSKQPFDLKTLPVEIIERESTAVCSR